MIHAAAVALIHKHNVHPSGHPVASHPQHVLRFGRSLKTVHYNQCQRVRAFALPITPAPHLDSQFNLDQPLFRRWQMDAARQQKAGDRLQMSTAQPAARSKRRMDASCALRRCHGCHWSEGREQPGFANSPQIDSNGICTESCHHAYL